MPSWIQGNSLTPPKRAGDSRSESGIGRSCPDLGAKLVGLCEGDERLIRLAPAEAFGDWDPNAILTVRESRIAGDVRLEDGMTVRIETSVGMTAVCRVHRLSEDRIALDLNHPLAGESLTLFIRVVRVAPPIRPLVGAER